MSNIDVSRRLMEKGLDMAFAQHCLPEIYKNHTHKFNIIVNDELCKELLNSNLVRILKENTFINQEAGIDEGQDIRYEIIFANGLEANVYIINHVEQEFIIPNYL